MPIATNKTAALKGALGPDVTNTGTTLTAQAVSGQPSLTVASSDGAVVGEIVTIGAGGTVESKVVLSIPNATTITLSTNLASTHAIGEAVKSVTGDHAAHHNALANFANDMEGVWINIKKHGAVGDGVTDDLAAINAAMTAAPNDGVIYFPGGLNSDYGISGPIQPPSGKRLKFYSAVATARYDPDPVADGTPRIRCLTGFTGSAMFLMPADSRNMAIVNLNLSGNLKSTAVNGIQFPTNAQAVAGPEHGVRLSWLNIVGFTGHGITGQMALAKIDNCTVMGNQGWGGYFADSVTDCWFHQNIWSFNKLGGVYYTNLAHHGHNYHQFDRFERSGDFTGTPNSPINADSPGLCCERGWHMNFIGCATDGNTGDGLLFKGNAVNAEDQLHDVNIIAGSFSRDGTGARTGTNPANRAGIRIEGFGSPGASGGSRIGLIRIIGPSVANGNPDDTGGGVSNGPTNALILTDTNFVEVIAGRYLSVGAPIVLSGNWKPSINISNLDLMTAPINATGQTYFPVGAIRSNTAGALETWDGSTWLPAVTNPVRDPARVAPPGNINIAAPGAALDTVTMVANDRVLLPNQTNGAQNGLWSWNGAAVPMTRTADANTSTKLTQQLLVSVDEGQVNKDSIFLLTSNKPITVDTTVLRYTRVHPAPVIQSKPANVGFAPTGAKIENMERSSGTFTNQAALVSGTVRVFPLGLLRAGDTLSALNFMVSTAGSGNPTNSWAGIARLSDRAVLAISTTATGAGALPNINTVKTFTFGTPFTADKDELLIGFVMFQNTTPPAFYGVNQGNAIIFSTTPVVNGTSNTGATTALALGAILTAFTADTEVLYCYAT